MRLARRAVPDMVWAYIDYGAEDLQTLRANREAFGRYMLRTRVLTGNEASDLSVTIGNQTISLPVLLAPTGLVGLSHWTGERGAAQAAERAGTLSILSTAGSYSFEEVAEGTEKDHFFQLYPWADLTTGRHDLTYALMQRAQRAGYKAMFVTVDVPVHGNRESERKRGMGNPPGRHAEAGHGGRHPAPVVVTQFLRHRRISARNLVESVGARAAVASLRTQFRMMRPELNWDDFKWMRDHWDGPLYIKGLLDAEDAEIAVNIGAQGVVVSNHGGRQLDWAVSALDALPAVAGGWAIGPRCSSTAACGGAPTSSRRSAWGPTRCASGARTCTGWPPPGARRGRARDRYFPRGDLPRHDADGSAERQGTGRFLAAPGWQAIGPAPGRAAPTLVASAEE